jgi:2,3-bisphosphoglycerate-dependent phosphoglycerate mutase
MTTRLLFIRHAESVHSVTGTVGGAQSDHGLTDRGHCEAAALADRLAAEPIAAIYASILPRATQTAAPLAAAHKIPVTEDCGLCTWHYPPWADGLPKTALAARTVEGGGIFRPFQQDNETWADLVVRTSKAILAIAHRHADESVAIVAHTETISASFRTLGNVPLYAPFDVVADPAAITEWTTDDPPTNWPPPRWTLRRLNTL